MRKIRNLAGWMMVGFVSMAWGVNALPADQTSTPVRVPRTFFEEGQLKGTLTTTFKSQTQQKPTQFESQVRWSKEETTQPAPREGALADFRDQTGCAEYQNLDSVAVCFTVMGDVFSLGVNSQEMQLRGLESFLTTQLSQNQESRDCNYVITGVQFDKADRQDQQLTVQFQGTATPTQNCSNQAQQDVNIEFKFQVA